MSILFQALPFNKSAPPIAGAMLWADATQTPTGTITTWNDLSGNGRNFTGTGTAKPVCTANLQNSKNGIVFDGVNDYLATSSFTAASQPNSIFVVAKESVVQSCWFFDGIAINNRNGFDTTAGTKHGFYAGNSVNSTTTVDTSAHIHTGLFNQGSSTYYLDNTSIATGDVGIQTLTGVTLGSRYTTTDSFFNGVIYEVLVYNRLLSANERILTNKYLSQKWAITIS